VSVNHTKQHLFCYWPHIDYISVCCGGFICVQENISKIYRLRTLYFILY